MANREALRELQSRLAERLQLARTESRSASWLAVECAEQGFLVPLTGAGEIFPVGTLLPVPHTRPWFLGVANLRGGLHGVVDLAAFLGLRAPLAPDAPREQARLLALGAALGAHCALWVDRLSGLRSAEQLSAEPDPQRAMGAEPDDGALRPVFARARWRDAEGRSWQELDLAALARHEHFLGIAA
jgi:twitching motility protein PilI